MRRGRLARRLGHGARRARARLPLVLVPQGADQFENAARCERAGAAVVLPPDDGDGGRGRGRGAARARRSPAYAEAARTRSRPRSRQMGTAGGGRRGGRGARGRVASVAACPHAPAPCWSWPCWPRSPLRSSSARRLSPPTRSTVRRPRQAAPKPRKGVPPLELSLGVRDDAEATELRRAAALYADGKRQQAAADLRALRLARGEARRRLRGLAGERGPDRAARRALSPQLARAAPRRAGPLLGRHGRRADRLARGARRRAGHAVRGPRGRLHPRAGLRARPARLRRQLRLPDRGRDAGRAAAAGSPPTGRCAGGCSTGSRCRDSAARSPRAAPSRRRGSSRRTTSTRSSPMRSGATTRETRRRRSPASARSAAASRMRRRCASTSACCCSGRRT